MTVNVRMLPKSLKDILKTVGKNFGENINTYLIEEQLDGKKAIKIDYDLSVNASMFDVDDKTSSISKLKNDDNQSFLELVNRVGIHLFGDNVSVFHKEHQADKGDGHWEVVIDNFKDDETWVTPVVFLVPHGIDL